MDDQPRHPEKADDHDDAPATGPPLKTYAFACLVVAAVLAMVLLHVTGVVGPGAH